MLTLALAMALATAGPGDVDLPRSLSDDASYALRAPTTEEILAPQAKGRVQPEWWVGGHLGVLDIYDADSASFLIGGSGRVHILPWLGAEASIDLAFGGDFENNDVSVFLVPFEFAALFYPPVEWPVRPYGTAGIGFTIIDVHYSGALSGVSDHTDLRPLFFIGFGAEFDLTPGIMLDANFRFVFVNNPSRFQGNSADWFQFTVGILFKLSQ